MGERSKVVAQLVNPLVAEMAAVVRASLDPGAFFSADFTDVAGSTDRFFQVPPNSLVFCRLPPSAGPPAPSGPKDITAFAYMPQDGNKDDEAPARYPKNLRVLGVVASPVDDPAVVNRHRDELAHLAVYVSGTHTIFAHPDDCEGLYPTNYIKVDFSEAWPGRLAGTDGDARVDSAFPVPKITRAETPEEAFAMVLQVGRSELRILLLTQRFVVSAAE
jgi:hypothetical protein